MINDLRGPTEESVLEGSKLEMNGKRKCEPRSPKKGEERRKIRVLTASEIDDRRRFTSAGIGGIFVPMPAAVDVRSFRLLGVQHSKSETVREQIDTRALRKLFSRLLTAVHHHDQRHVRERCTGR